jgi:hypothetical protein
MKPDGYNREVSWMGEREKVVDLNKIGSLLVRIWVLALLFGVIGIPQNATHHMRHLF